MAHPGTFFSIRRKFLLLSFSIILVFAMSAAAVIAKIQEKKLHESLNNKGQALGIYIAAICKDALLLKEVMQLDALVTEAHHDPEIIYTVIDDADGTPLTTPLASMNNSDPQVKAVLAQLPPDSPMATILTALRKDKDIRELTQKVMIDTSAHGTVRIGVSEKKVHQQVQTGIIIIGGGMLLMSLAVGIALHLSTNRLVLRPLAQLCAVTKEIAAGDLTVTIPVHSHDEIGVLAQALTTMTNNLNQMIANVDRITRLLTAVTDTLSHTAGDVNSAAETQAAGIDDAHQAILDINLLIRNIITSIEELAQSTAASRSSTFEMISSIGEVANNSENLARSVGEVSSSITEIIASVHEVNNGVDVLNLKSGTTAAAATQLASSVTEVESAVHQITAISETVRQDAHSGQEAVMASLQGIEKIKLSSDITFDVITTLSTRVADIGTILSVIEEVTEQTELLALNAAIIAAQAGDHGKGFAVVADEIKELAERTNASTREISQVITGVQDETERAVTAIQQAELAIDEGMALANRSGTALDQIYNGIEQTVSQMRAITQVTSEQAAASQGISAVMAEVSYLVQQIARATEEQSNGGQLILGSTEDMKNLTDQVMLSTREQKAGSRHIADAVEAIALQMRTITTDCAKEQNSSETVVNAMTSIRQVSATNLAASKQMNEAVTRLLAHIAELRQEISLFRV